MLIKLKYRFVLFFTAGMVFTHLSFSQEAIKPRVSPLEMVTLKYENTYVKITYGRPHKNNRVIFGQLVPFDQVWRTGANEATEITLTHDVLINKERLKAGTYTIFTIPEKDSWKVIFNSDLGQWGAYNYNPDKNVLIANAPVAATNDVYEPFTIEFQLQDTRANLLMMWDTTKATVVMEFVD